VASDVLVHLDGSARIHAGSKEEPLTISKGISSSRGGFGLGLEHGASGGVASCNSWIQAPLLSGLTRALNSGFLECVVAFIPTYIVGPGDVT